MFEQRAEFSREKEFCDGVAVQLLRELYIINLINQNQFDQKLHVSYEEVKCLSCKKGLKSFANIFKSSDSCILWNCSCKEMNYKYRPSGIFPFLR